MKISQAINIGTQFLIKNNIKTPSLDSEILMSKAIKKDKKFIILNSSQKIKENSFKYFKSLIEQRSNGKPVAYLIGNKSFWNYQFKISSDVLIPRPDTELIIQEVLKIVKNKNKLNILDIYTQIKSQTIDIEAQEYKETKLSLQNYVKNTIINKYIKNLILYFKKIADCGSYDYKIKFDIMSTIIEPIDDLIKERKMKRDFLFVDLGLVSRIK